MSVIGWATGAQALRAAAIVLLFTQLVLVVIRGLASRMRLEYLLLCGFLAALATLEIAPSSGFPHAALLIGASWAGTGFLITVERKTWLAPWSAGSAVFAVVLLLVVDPGHGATLPFHLLSAFGILVLSGLPLGLLLRRYRATGAMSALLVFCTGVAWLAAGAVDLVRDAAGRDPLFLSSMAVFCMALWTGWLILQQGYPLRPGWGGALPAAESHDATRALYARLLASESTLAWQNRLIGSGVLAAGAAHEFKNTLAQVKAAAQHGLSLADVGRKDESLCLIIECSQAGRDSAVEVLERISSTEDEMPCVIDASRDLCRLIRMCQAAFRGQSIRIESTLDPCPSFRARRCDVELALLNLLRNAADAYEHAPLMAPGLITVHAGREGESAVIEVRDGAGGIPQEALHRLFRPMVSSAGGTGIGLYLSHNLVQGNGGSLEYRPIEGGSLFRMSFPAEEQAETGSGGPP